MWRSSTLWCTFSVEMAKGSEGMERPFNGGLRNWWRDQHIYKAESVTLKVKREEVVSHVWWAWNQENVQLLKRWRDHLLRLTFRPRMRTGEDWVTYRRSCARAMRARWKGMGLLNMNCHWRRYNGNVPLLPVLATALTRWCRHRPRTRQMLQGGNTGGGTTTKGRLGHSVCEMVCVGGLGA